MKLSVKMKGNSSQTKENRLFITFAGWGISTSNSPVQISPTAFVWNSQKLGLLVLQSFQKQAMMFSDNETFC